MSPHRLSAIRCYKISDDILILILEKLDLQSLLAMCRAFQRAYVIVMEFQPLRYRFELALAGMKDGPVSHREMSPLHRLQLLIAYRKDWPKLYWTHELPGPIAMSVGVSGGFLYNIRSDGNHSELRIAELPSCRTGRAPESTRHLKFITTRIEGVVIDPTQAFIATSHVANAQNGPVIQLKLRDMWTFDKHPKALQHAFDFAVPLSAEYARISGISLSVCSSKLAISVKFIGGRSQHLLIDWHTFQTWLLTVHDITFLNENLLLVAKHSNGRPVLNLYNIVSVANITVEREYELPESWNNCQIEIRNNVAPCKDPLPSIRALFYPDPSARMLCIAARRAISSDSGPVHYKWLFVNESYFKPSRRTGLVHVPWTQWGNHCLVREVSQASPIKGPYSIGTRFVYLEPIPSNGRPRLHTIGFTPYAEWKYNSPWSWRGQKVVAIPLESSRDIPDVTASGLAVEDLRITEDNIILFLNNGQGAKQARILTFGAGPSLN
ncbi:hypothetical protein AX15_003089 [Amanita polypyramis BW_CC]|nr:hypothetical protein AX15_003089 [Amanita polypyramis BW_CC]